MEVFLAASQHVLLTVPSKSSSQDSPPEAFPALHLSLRGPFVHLLALEGMMEQEESVQGLHRLFQPQVHQGLTFLFSLLARFTEAGVPSLKVELTKLVSCGMLTNSLSFALAFL